MEEYTDSVGRLAFWPNMDLLSSERLLWMCPHKSSDSALCVALRDAVATQLSPRQREVIEGYFFEGISQPDLAKKLGVRQQVVHKCIYGTQRNGRMVGGALKKLRAALLPFLSP